MQLRQLALHLLVAQPARRTAAAVKPVKFVVLRAVNDREKIAADSVRDRLHQAERGVGRDRGIDRAAAAFQNVEPDLRRRRHARANHPMPRQHLRARGPSFSRDPIDLRLERTFRRCLTRGREQASRDEVASANLARRALSPTAQDATMSRTDHRRGLTISAWMTRSLPRPHCWLSPHAPGTSRRLLHACSVSPASRPTMPTPKSSANARIGW